MSGKAHWHDRRRAMLRMLRLQCSCITGLDSSQLEAVSLALSSQDIALVHGPPGTGKPPLLGPCTLIRTSALASSVAAAFISQRHLMQGTSQVLMQLLVRCAHHAQQMYDGHGQRQIHFNTLHM